MKRLITERELEDHPEGQPFAVKPDMIVTPSARDYASRHGVALIYASQKEAAAPEAESAMDRAIRDAVIAELGHADREVMHAVRAATSRAGVSAGTGADPLAGASAALMRAAREKDKTSRAVLAAMGTNRTGILSRLTSVLSENDCDIVNVSQTIVDGYFNMILIVEIGGLEAAGITFDDFRTRVLNETTALGLEAMLMHEDVLRAMHRVTLN